MSLSVIRIFLPLSHGGSHKIKQEMAHWKIYENNRWSLGLNKKRKFGAQQSLLQLIILNLHQ